MRSALHYLTLIKARDEAQNRMHAAFRTERRLRFEHAAAVCELDDAKADYAAALAAMKADPAALAAAE